MAKPILDSVSAQLYGDRKVQEQIIELLSKSGFGVNIKSGKDYVTKKDESGYYRSVSITV